MLHPPAFPRLRPLAPPPPPPPPARPAQSLLSLPQLASPARSPCPSLSPEPRRSLLLPAALEARQRRLQPCSRPLNFQEQPSLSHSKRRAAAASAGTNPQPVPSSFPALLLLRPRRRHRLRNTAPARPAPFPVPPYPSPPLPTSSRSRLSQRARPRSHPDARPRERLRLGRYAAPHRPSRLGPTLKPASPAPAPRGVAGRHLRSAGRLDPLPGRGSSWTASRSEERWGAVIRL